MSLVLVTRDTIITAMIILNPSIQAVDRCSSSAVAVDRAILNMAATIRILRVKSFRAVSSNWMKVFYSMTGFLLLPNTISLWPISSPWSLMPRFTSVFRAFSMNS